MSELNSTYEPMLLPSLEVHCMQEAENRLVCTRVIALELLIDSRCNDDDLRRLGLVAIASTNSRAS